jgi:hypothetical protein
MVSIIMTVFLHSSDNEEPSILASNKFFIYGDTQPPKLELEKLIKAAGGHVATSFSNASIAVKGKIKLDPYTEEEDAKTPIVGSEYVLDCISKWSLLNTDKYTKE